MKSAHRVAGAVATTVMTLGLFTACATDNDDNAETAEPDAVASTETAESPDSSDDAVSDMPEEDADLRDVTFPIAPQDAIDTATGETGDGDVHAIELDHDSDVGTWIYSVKVLTESDGDENDDHKVIIDPVTGEVIDHETDQTSDTEEAIDLDDPMTYDEALEKATDEVDDALRGWKYEWDDGQYEYQFDLGSVEDSTEVSVDPETGNVTTD